MRRLFMVMAIAVLVVTACSQDGSATSADGAGASSTVAEETAASVEDTVQLTVPASSTSTVDADSDPVDPWGLSGVEMPRTQAGVTKVLVGMPDDIDGMQVDRDQDTDHVGFVSYEQGADEWLRIFWTEIGPDAESAVDTLWIMSQNEMFTIESTGLDSGEDFVWLEGFATEPDRVVYLAWFGEPANGWMFQVEADSIEHRTAVIEAFTASVTS